VLFGGFLNKQLLHDGIKKLVSLEIYLWAKSYIGFLKSNNIKTYSILYLSDSLWVNDKRMVESIDRTYYTTEYLMNTHHEFVGVKYDKKMTVKLYNI